MSPRCSELCWTLEGEERLLHFANCFVRNTLKVGYACFWWGNRDKRQLQGDT